MRIKSDEEFNKALSKRMLSLRKMQRLTQKQVAENLGVSQPAYVRYESNERRIPVGILPSLAKALDSSIEELLGINNPRSKRGQISQVERRFNAVKELPKKNQQEILKVVDALIAQAS